MKVKENFKMKLNPKSFLFILILFSSLFANCQHFTKEDIAIIKPLIQKGCKVKYDEHQGIIWVKSKNINIQKSSTFDQNSITWSIYFGIEKINGKILVLPMRIINDLYLTDWLFFTDVDILYGTLQEKKEGTRQQFSFNAGDTQRKILGSSYVSEISDVVVNSQVLELLSLMSKEPKPLNIRYTGSKQYIEKFYCIGIKSFQKKVTPVLESYTILSNQFNLK